MTDTIPRDTFPQGDDADRLEQAMTIDVDDDREPVSPRWDADLADRIDQSGAVPLPDDY